MIQDYFHKIDSEQKAYWLGFILGDGCLGDWGGRFTIQLSLNIRDENHIDKFAKAIHWHNRKTYRKETDSVRMPLCSKQMYHDLLRLGVTPNKSLTARWPKIPKKYEIHMLRGLFDADGCITTYGYNKYPRFALVGTKNCLQNAKRILGITNRICPDVTIWQISKGGRNVVGEIYYKLYKNATVYLTRKKKRFEELLR